LSLGVFGWLSAKMLFSAYRGKRSVSKTLPVGDGAKDGKMMSLVG
jgi:hypothetical protein